MQRSLDTWAMVSSNALKLPGDSLPWIVLFDAQCTWHLAPRSSLGKGAVDVTQRAALRFGGQPVVVHRLAHTDSIRLPSGPAIPAHPMAFASLYRGDSATFLVMALPSLWATSGRARDSTAGDFFLGVLAHEMVHTRQLITISRHVRALAQRFPLPANVNDDIVQQHFDSIPEFRRSVEKEIDLLFRAAVAAETATQRRLAAEALQLAQRRRARFFSEARAVYAPLEDIFLLMEGVGSLAAYRVAFAMAPSGSTTESVVAQLRRNKSWSQTMGLALFLVIDALVPGWQRRVFAEDPASVFDLLREAASRERR